MSMQNWCPFAAKKPLGSQIEPSIGTPRIFIIHTMSGYLAGTDSMFRQNGYSGTESHFGIGGAYDGAHDGDIWQWQDLSHGADAQYAGNAYATSVETSDGAHDGVRWSPKQAEAIIRLGVWWCQQTGHPARLVTSPDQAGFGWHAQFSAWNRNSHDCPGSVRLKQYKTEIIPAIAQRLAGDMTPQETFDAVWKTDAIPAPAGSAASNPTWQAQSYLTDIDGRCRELQAKVDAMTTTLGEIAAAVIPPPDPRPQT